jgi:hypothetical protein
MRSDRSRFGIVSISLMVVAFAVACQPAGFVTCDDRVCPQGYQCRGQQCVSDEQVAVCEPLAEESACVADLDGLCREGYCQINMCGNALLDVYPVRGAEACDGELGVLACADAGADFGWSSCSNTCTVSTIGCESFAWQRAITGAGEARAVTGSGDGRFVARGNRVSWTRGVPWTVSQPASALIADLIALDADQALAVVLTAPLQIWSYNGPNNTLSKTNITISTGVATRWSGGAALSSAAALISRGSELRLYRLMGSTWGDTAVTLQGTCPAGDIEILWGTSTSTVYAAIGTRVVRLDASAANVSCSVVRDLGQAVVAVGGQGVTLQWAVDRSGRVYDATTWIARNNKLPESFALDSAVAQYLGGEPRLWSTEGDDILLFHGGSWWRSIRGSTVVRDDLGDRVQPHRPLWVKGDRVFAAQAAQEVGLVERNSREWLAGPEFPTDSAVLDVAVDATDRAWTLLANNQIAIGSRIGSITPALSAPMSSLTFTAAATYIGAGDGVYKISEAGGSFPATLEGNAIGQVRNLWSGEDGNLYALTLSGLYVKAPATSNWSLLWNPRTDPQCPLVGRMTGAVVRGAPLMFVVCRLQNSSPRSNQLLVFDVSAAAAVLQARYDLPDFAINVAAASADGTVWLASTLGRMMRVPPPYVAHEILPVIRLSAINGKLGSIADNLTDVIVTATDDIYLAGANQNLFWWDGQRFVRVSSSQRSSVSYVALAAKGRHLYAGYESGVDLLYRVIPAP